jgi:hypothetical protein
MMNELPFGAYEPDKPPLRNTEATLVKNCRPSSSGYSPFNGLSVLSDALTAYCRGAISARDVDGNTYTYAADANSYYKLTTTAFTTANGTTPSAGSGEGYEFAQYGNQVVGVHYSGDASEETQVITLGGAAFADLFTSTLKPRARHVVSLPQKGFIVMGNTYDAVDGNQPQRIWWTAQNDITDADPSATTQSGFQNLPSGDGWVQKLVAHEFVIIFMERAIYRMSYEGPPTLFRFDRLVPNYGCLAPGSIASLGRLAFFLSQDGLKMTDGLEIREIGKNKIDETLLADLDSANLDRVSSCIDPENSLYMMAYPSIASNGTPDKILLYHWGTQRFAIVEQATEFLFLDQTKGYTLETLDTITTDLDALVESLDSRFYTGGNYLVSAFNTDHKLCSFTGSALTAVIETGEAQPFAPYRSIVNEIRPLVDGTSATTTIQIGTRNLLTEAVTWGSALSIDAFGSAKCGVDARYMRMRANISGGFDHAQGLQPDGRRGGLG